MGGYSIKLNKYNLLIVFILVLFLLSLTAVSAKDTNDTKILNDNKDEPVLNSHEQVQKELKSEINGSNNFARDNELVDSNGQVQDDLKENNIVENNQSLKVKNSDNILGKNENDDKLMKVTFTVNSKAWNSISVSFVDDWVQFSKPIQSFRSSSGTFTCNGISTTASCSAQKMASDIAKFTASGTLSATSTKWFTPGQTYTISFSGTLVIEAKGGGSKSQSVSGSTTVTIPKLDVGAVSCSLSTSSYTYGDGAVTLSGSIAGLNDKFSAGGTVNIYRNGTKIGSTTCAADGSFSYNVAAGSTTPAGKYQYWAEYMGNDYYNKASATSSKCDLQINKKATTGIDITPSINYQYASINAITLTGTVAGVVSSHSAGSVNIYRNGTKIGTATIGSTGAYTYTINTESVDEGNYVYWATYDGNTYYKAYEGTSNDASVTVTKGDISTASFSTGDIVYLNDKTLTVTLKNAKGTLIKNALVTLLGNGIVGNLTATTNNNGVATFTISGLNATTYDDWQIHIDEFTNYNAFDANAPSFKVTPATLTVTVTSNGDIDADQDEIITVYIKNAKNQNLKDMVAVVTGKDIPQGGVSKTSGDDGIANIAIGNLNPVTTYNDWKVKIYDPYGNYNNVTKNIDEFFVNKGKPRLVIDAPAISYGADAIITIGLPDTANGTVKLYVGLDWNYTLNITNGEYSVTIPRPAAGSYQITAEYSGNDRWKPVTANSHLYVERPGAYTYIEVEDINYGEEALIKFSIYTNESRTEFLNNTRGSITVYGLNNASGYITNVNNGRAELRVKGLTRGTWNVVSYYSGDNEWKGGISTAAFNVNALQTDLIITANNTILTDYNLWVTVNVNNTINDTVYLYVDGVMYAVAFTSNGKALFNLYNLSAGSHNITAKFLANDAFDSATNSTMITVNKRDVDYNINLTAGRDIVFNITVNNDIIGLINITGNGTSVVRTPVNGNVYYVIEKVKRGLYSFNITYEGNWKYNPFNTVRTINVEPVTDYVLNITSDDAVYNETISIYVHTLSDLDGKNITLTLFGKKYNATVSGGVAVFNNIYLVNATTGSFDVGALYVGDDVYGFNQNTTTIPVIPTSRYDIIVKVQESAFVGDDVLINITAPTNKINITINGVRKEIDVGSYILDDVSEGIYDIIASYNGDKMFAAKNSTISSLKVIKHNITLTVTANDTIYGNFTTINVLLSNNVTGVLLIRLDSKEYLYVSLNNQKDTVIIDNTFSVGTHNITVEFLGDTNFNKAVNSTVFTISKSNEYNLTVYQNNTLVLNGSDVALIEGDNLILTIDLPSDATGHVIVKLLKDSTQITSWDLTLPNNLITYKLKDVGNYTVEIEYSGDTNYTDSNFNFNLNVTPKLIVSNITFSDDNYFVLSDSILNITTNLDNRTLSIFVDGIFYKNVTVNDLKASVNLAKLSAGNHTVTVKFDSDDVFTSLYVSHDIFVNKLNSTVVVSAADIDQGHMVTVDVVASGNGTANITIYNGTSILTGPFTIVINNGVGQFMVPYTFPIVNSYTINVTYNGDENYLTSTNSSVFNVLPSNDYLFNVITNDAYVGDNVVVNVTLPGNANQNVVLTFENGTNVTVKAVNGSAIFNLANLAYANYTVNVTYVGDYNYQKVTKQAKFSVDKRIILVNLTTNTTDGSLAEGFIGSTVQADKLNLTITLADDATGKVNVYLNDILVAENLDLVNGKTSTILNGFNVGVDTVKVVYSGDDKYYNNTAFGNILVASDYGRLNVTVDRKTYVVDDNVDLIIRSNAGGNVSIYVNGELLDTLWINKELTYTLNNITYGDKNVLVILHANENYTGVFNTTNFTVIKKNTTLDVNVVGNSASLPVTVVITVENGVTGWVNALVNGTTPQTARGLINNNQVTLTFYGLEVGNHTLTVNYEGDERFNTNTTNKTFKISKSYYFPVNVTVEDVYVGDNATVCVILPDGARGLINITLNGQYYTGILNNSRVNITIPYTAINREGKYNIVVAYNGSDEFNATSVASSFNVLRISKYPFIVNVSDIKFGDIAVLNITLPADINNTKIKVYINNKEYNVTINDGVGKLELPNLAVGSKAVRVVFDGNYKYVESNVSDRFVVSPHDVLLNVTVVVDALNARVNVNATPGINETVHIYVAGLNKTVKLVNGIGSVLFTDLTAGNYTALAVFEGNENYTASSNKTLFIIEKPDFNITIDVLKDVLWDGESNTITITYNNVPSTDLIITVNGKSYPLVISKNNVNTTAVIRLDDLREDKYNVSVKYIGEEYKHANASKVFNVFKYAVNASESIIVWQNVNVTVVMPDNASGIVNVRVNGKNYNKTIVGGKITIDVPGLTVGTHTLEISYSNDPYYGVFSVNKTVVVNKFSDYNIVIVNPVNPEVDVDNTISIVLPANATGNVAVYLDGKLLENATLNDGQAIINVLGNLLSAGNHTIRAVYYGDVNYTAGENSSVFNVFKQNITVSVVATNVSVFDNSVVSITTNLTNADGIVIVNVNGVNYTANINGNTASVTLNKLAFGDYDITVYYNGNNKYNKANATGKLNIYKLNTTVDAVSDANVISVKLDNRTSGLVYVEFNGTKYSGVIFNGTASIVLPMINGTYDLVVKFDGDNNFNANNTDVTVTIYNDSEYLINITVDDPVIGVANSIVVTLPDNAEGNVSVYLDGVLLTTGPLVGGKLIVPVGANLMIAGNHTVRAVYAGSSRYVSGENTTNFTVIKKDLTIDLDVNNIKVGDIETITVKVPNDATGVILLTVNGTKYYINLENGTGSINITKLTSGIYPVVAVYEGSDLYNPVNKSAEFVVSKISDYEMNVTYTNVTNNATKVTVTLPDDATGIVTINVNGTNFTGVIYKGKAVIDVVNLTNPVYPYIAIWDGDEKYVNASKSGIIHNTEYREESVVVVSVEDILVSQSAVIKINVTAGATGTVRISVNGKNIVVPLVNSNAVYTLAGLGNGTYKVDVVYSGDDIYITSENSTTFNVNKYNSTINVAPGTGKVGENITVVVSGPGDANGTVEITINGTKYTVDMINGTALLNVSFNKHGTYTVVADYAGNNKYNGNSSDSTIVVNPLTPSVNITVSDIKVGENATVTVFVPGDATGNVTLEIVGGSYSQTVAVSAGKAVFTIPGLGNGTYNIMATFNGDGKYDVMSNVSSFNVTKIDIVPDVRANPIVENKTNITVYVPKDVNGNIILVVGDRTITSPIIDGTARFNLDNVGNGTNISFVFDGDDKYNKFNTSAVLYDSGIKLSSALSIMISDIIVGENATITVGVTERATGNITINIDGRTFTKVIQDGKVTFTVGDLAYGTYNVTATYSGDDKFLSSNITSSIFVNKYISLVIVNVGDIKVGVNATIIVKVPDDATGNVSLKINGIVYNPVTVSDGKAVFTISGLGNGTYIAVATYNGNAKYLNSTGNATFNVSKIDINPVVNSTSVLDNKTTVTVIVPGDATGNITIVVGGKNFTEVIDNGKAVINLNNVSDGTPISVVYAGDDKYNEFAVDAVITDQGVRLNPQVIVVSDKDNYLAGETAVITITVPNDAKGNVTIKIRGETVNISDISDGKVIYNYVVPTSGNFNVEVIYNGDNKYASERNTTLFTADKINTTVIIDVNNTPVGKNVTVVVTVPNDATGNITITVGSTQYSKAIDNGTVVFNLPALDRNTYEVIANYEPLGDLKYLGGKNSTKFDVTGKSTSIEVTAEAITYGENAEIIVRVDSNATGHISITVGNDTYLGNIDNNGVARIIVPNLKPGIVNFEVSYDGDINFDGNSTSSSVVVNRKTTNVEVSADNITDEETAVITVVVPSDATGTVTITVDGKNYTESVNNGVASFNITGLSAGRYLIDAVYNGDTYWNVGENATVWFTVRTSKTIHVETISRGYNSGLDYQAVFTDEFGNPLANTNVTFAVGGKEYTVLTDENGVASLNIGLAPGNHTIVAVNPVTGDESYNTTNIVPRLVENKPVVMDFADGSKFAVRAIGDDGKPVGAGEKVLMFVNGITYEVITDETGLAELTINLNPNWYLITAQYKGYNISDNIEVKQILTAKKVQKVKKSKKKNKVKAKLRFSNGKPLSGVKVTMKIKSKILTAKTNSKGVAKFKLSKKVVKKLKVGKKYRVTFTYLTNTINKHIKVKR